MLISNISDLAEAHPHNLALKAFDATFFAGLPDEEKPGLLKCMNSCVTQPSAGQGRPGAFACSAEDYQRFRPFFAKTIKTFHNMEPGAVHVNEWYDACEINRPFSTMHD